MQDAKNNFDKIIKNYKLKLYEKNEEINKLKEKNIFLNKKIKSLEESKNLNITNSFALNYFHILF